jgi:hypothetical protein
MLGHLSQRIFRLIQTKLAKPELQQGNDCYVGEQLKVYPPGRVHCARAAADFEFQQLDRQTARLPTA